jgi:hypothetical protein
MFYLDGGSSEEMDALVRFAAERYPGKDVSVAIVESEHERSRQAAKWLRARLSESGRVHVTLAEGDQPVNADLIFCLGPFAKLRMERGAVVMVPGSLMGGAAVVPPNPSTTLFVAYNSGMPEHGTGSEATLRPLWNRATASAALMVEAMRIAGRTLSRSSVVAALESFREVGTDLGVPISFGPARRIGATGAQPVLFEFVKGRMVPLRNR